MTSQSQKVILKLPWKGLTLTNENEVKQSHYKNPSGEISEKQKLKPDVALAQRIQSEYTQSSRKLFSDIS